MNKVLYIIATISTILFIITQLIINSSLNPQGAKLAKLNQEKDMLIENNRKLSEELSYTKSVTVISELATKKLGLNNEASAKSIYISDPTYAQTR